MNFTATKRLTFHQPPHSQTEVKAQNTGDIEIYSFIYILFLNVFTFYNTFHEDVCLFCVYIHVINV